MDEFGRSKIPFIFIIDFEMERIIVSSIKDLSDEIRIQFPQFSHVQKHIPVREEYNWKIKPIDLPTYERGFRHVQAEIHKGNTFLLNLAYPTSITTDLSLDQLFYAVHAKYKVFVEEEFIFFSPETFVKISDGYIYTYPMKGTIDADLPDALQTILEDQKELAEHFTIVDLLRNDLSIVAKDVTVTKFRYPDYIHTNDKNLIQISSEIRGELPANYPSAIGTILFGLLPAGSISGAPKKKTLEIIRTAEGRTRGYYTGISGYFDGNILDSCVNIRYIEQKNEHLNYMSGGGITFQSELMKEYSELIDKVYLPVETQAATPCT